RWARRGRCTLRPGVRRRTTQQCRSDGTCEASSTSGAQKALESSNYVSWSSPRSVQHYPGATYGKDVCPRAAPDAPERLARAAPLLGPIRAVVMENRPIGPHREHVSRAAPPDV